MNTIKTTLLGGILFLVPFVFIIMILEKAYALARKVTVPIKAIFPDRYFFGVNLIILPYFSDSVFWPVSLCENRLSQNGLVNSTKYLI